MAKKIGIYSLEVSSGKTITTAFLAEALTTLGKKVMCVDLSPNQNLGKYLNLTINDLLSLDNSRPAERVKKITQGQFSWDYLSIGTSDNIEGSLSVFEDYNYVLLDFPSFNTETSLVYLEKIDSVIVPIESEFYGLDKVSETLETVIKNNLLIDGLLLTKYDTNNELLQKFEIQIRENFKDMVFDSIINRSYYLGLEKFNIESLNQASTHFGFTDYLKLANELV